MNALLINIVFLVMIAVAGQCFAATDLRCEVDWNSSLYIVEGQAVVQNPKQTESREKALLDARKTAAGKMMVLIQKTNLQGQDPASILEKDPVMKGKIVSAVYAAKPSDTRFMTSQAKAVAVVTLKIPVFGPDGLGTVIIAAADISTASTPSKVDISGSGYTSLVIDAAGLNVKRSMCPRILKTSGEAIYTGETASIDQIETFGIAAYAKSLDKAGNIARCGSKPLIIKACGSSGIGNWDVVVSDEDAGLIQVTNNKYHFLDKLNVIIVVD